MSDTTAAENAAIVAFDANTLKKRVADYIQASFGALIPQEVFAAMCDKAVKDFFENRQLTQVIKRQKEVPGRASWDRSYVDYFELNVNVTPFELMVHEAMHERLAAALRKHLDEEKDQLNTEIAKLVDRAMEEEGGNKSLKVDLHAFLLTAGKLQLSAAMNTYSSMAHSNLMSAFRDVGAFDVANRLGSMPTPRV